MCQTNTHVRQRCTKHKAISPKTFKHSWIGSWLERHSKFWLLLCKQGRPGLQYQSYCSLMIRTVDTVIAVMTTALDVPVLNRHASWAQCIQTFQIPGNDRLRHDPTQHCERAGRCGWLGIQQSPQCSAPSRPQTHGHKHTQAWLKHVADIEPLWGSNHGLQKQNPSTVRIWGWYG